MNIWAMAGGYVAAAVFGWLLLEAKQDLGEEIERCNTDKALAISQAQEITRVAEREAAERALAKQAQFADKSLNAIQGAFEAERTGLLSAAASERDIFQTTLERFDEDLPDSGACLSVFVLERDVQGMR